MSPAAPRMLGLEALINSVGLCELISAVRDAYVSGDHAQVGRLLPLAGRIADDMAPAFIEVITAKLRDLSERMPGPRLICGAFWGVPHPYPHTPDSEHHATPDTTQPAA